MAFFRYSCAFKWPLFCRSKSAFTEVKNVLLEDGCTISDLFFECPIGADSHGEFVSAASYTTNALKK
jgi:hypothetical protein